ncbi:SDR family oxidoreductase [Leifsonia poae]|uniref:SDR family oxidoreductase n=1 Tax=Leifsonia poae TaxID=110933 RepID=UPI001CBC14DB|nr:aldehyde reductase [Leifsonia poae]
MTSLVLVTGGSGFVGAHCVLALLNDGYAVRTTVRSASRADDVRAQLASAGVVAGERLSFAVADLTADDGWAEAVDGCDFVLHVASPFPSSEPADENELIVPARDGALRVLRAARDAGVRRVVLTSSFAAIGYGHSPTERAFTEEDWTELDSGVHVGAYPRSKTIAERAAWEFVAGQGADRRGGPLELATVNPVGILGPVLGTDYSSSILLVKTVVDGRVPRLPRLSFGVVDVRDVAALHLLAMTHPEAAGERFLAVSGEPVSALELAQVVREHLGDAGSRIPTKVMPDGMLRMLAPFSRTVRAAAADVGVVRRASAEKARRLLGWEPRSPQEAIIATIDSLPPANRE